MLFLGLKYQISITELFFLKKKTRLKFLTMIFFLAGRFDEANGCIRVNKTLPDHKQ